MKKRYKILSLEKTKEINMQKYGSFNNKHYQEYIGKTGYVAGCYTSDSDNLFKDFICLITEVDQQGRPLDGDWFHKDDIEEVEEEVLIYKK